MKCVIDVNINENVGSISPTWNYIVLSYLINGKKVALQFGEQLDTVLNQYYVDIPGLYANIAEHIAEQPFLLNENIYLRLVDINKKLVDILTVYIDLVNIWRITSENEEGDLEDIDTFTIVLF